MDAPPCPRVEGLLPLNMTPDEYAEVTMPPDDPWMLGKAEEVVAYLRGHPAVRKATIVPFWIEDAELAGEPWQIRGVGLLSLTLSGRPTVLHRPGQQACYTAVRALSAPKGTPAGRVCSVATWFRSTGRPYTVEVWEALFARPGTDVRAHVYWRPDFAPPACLRMATDVSVLSRPRGREVEDALWAFLDGRSRSGRKTKGPDARFVRDLETTVRKLIIDSEGDGFSVEALVTHLLPGKALSTYYRILERNGLTSDQVQAWITECLRDYRKHAVDEEDWQLPIGLDGLLGNFRD